MERMDRRYEPAARVGTWMILADLVLVGHFAFAAFIVVGLALIWLGAFLKWRWITSRTFRLIHLGAILVVAFEALLGIACPLTVLEDHLRGVSSDSTFVGRWISSWLYYDMPAWTFTLAYVLVAAAVLLTLRLVPLRPALRESA